MFEGGKMKRYIEYGVFSAALFTLVYLIASLFSGVTINLTAVFLCIAGGLIAGFMIALLLIYFSPGEHIKEGEEDKYIKN